ncbi:MAG: HYExAFE family protein [Phycisphaerales bacterium]|nr:HYExAFE family protein [Phycisphaerales bacterium]
MKRHVHYEAAFEDYLIRLGAAHVPVDETRRAAFREARLKSFDFVVYSPRMNWIVDVKGRRWAGRGGAAKPTWENWITEADAESLTQWETVFGPGFEALLVFAYWIDPAFESPPEVTHSFRGEKYVFAAATLADYRLHARTRSPKWGTINVRRSAFVEMIRPMRECVA